MADLRKAIALTAYQNLSRCLQPLAPTVLRRRLAKGKEHPTRWTEKLGQTNTPRPEGRLVWLNGVGLGEVLSARTVVTALLERDPTLNFLITSTTRISAEVLEKNLPPRTLHQFLPLDIPKFTKRFLRHWQPDLGIWIEQDFWPGMVESCVAMDVPQLILNGRMNDKAFQKRSSAKHLYRASYAAMKIISAQDEKSATNIAALSGNDVTVQPSLKIIAPSLGINETEARTWAKTLPNQPIWATVSAHIADADIAIQAHKHLAKGHLVIVPRFAEDLPEMRVVADQAGLSHSNSADLQSTQIIFETRYGESSLWYHLAEFALVGGGFDETGGHNPWEAVSENCAILYGPNTANFAPDYRMLADAHAAISVPDAAAIVDALNTETASSLTQNAQNVVASQRQALAPLFDTVAGHIKPKRAAMC